jgi:hypothetical protein
MTLNRSAVLLHNLRFLLAVVSVSFLAGCNLCCPGYMDDFATVGGKWARTNPTEGRVGSVFSDTGSSSSGLIREQVATISDSEAGTVIIESGELDLHSSKPSVGSEIITLDNY